jgi:DNA-binding HxlR family transcriptional regulator
MKRQNKKGAYHCTIEAAFAIIGGKWKAGIIWHIGKEKLRFSTLRIPLGIISSRMLAKQLRELEADGLVTRSVYPEIPPRVEYELTMSGQALIPILDSISTWVTTYHPEILDEIT